MKLLFWPVTLGLAVIRFLIDHLDKEAYFEVEVPYPLLESSRRVA